MNHLLIFAGMIKVVLEGWAVIVTAQPSGTTLGNTAQVVIQNFHCLKLHQLVQLFFKFNLKSFLTNSVIL